MKYLEKSLDIASAFLILVMGLLVTADVAGRYLFRSPIQGTLEIVEFMMVGIVFFSLSYSQAQKIQIRVTLLLDKVHSRMRSFLEVLGLLIGLIFLALITLGGGILAWEAWRDGSVTVGLLSIPLAPAKFIIPIGAFIAVLRIALDLWSELRNFGKGSA